MRRLRWLTGLLFSALLILAAPASLSYAAGLSSYTARPSSYATEPAAYATEPAAYAADSPAYVAEPSSYVAEPSPHGSLAGSRAGVGRTPPGRELPTPTATGAVLPPDRTEPPPAEPREPRPERPAPARQAVGEPGAKPLVNVLPLGAGLLLTGLGLGFLALRLRR